MKKNKKNKNNKNISMQEALKAVEMITPHQMLSEKLIVDRAMDELKELAEPMSEYLIAARTNADLIRLYMERYIERIDVLLAVVDDVKPPEQDGEEDEYDDETIEEEMDDDEYPDCDGDCDHCHVYVRAVQNHGGSGQAE